MSIFKEARGIAQHCKDPARQRMFRDVTDECKAVFDRFAISASQSDMELLIAMWTKLLIAMKHMPPVNPTDPLAGGMPVPREKVRTQLASGARAA